MTGQEFGDEEALFAGRSSGYLDLVVADLDPNGATCAPNKPALDNLGRGLKYRRRRHDRDDRGDRRHVTCPCSSRSRPRGRAVDIIEIEFPKFGQKQIAVPAELLGVRAILDDCEFDSLIHQIPRFVILVRHLDTSNSVYLCIVGR
ncbi:hypothetical protein [Nocardia abscessus]|uniref:hypothetical protein n=1 Tax=Nocardia abscessus TaxID=120957 RepID=UPI0014615EF9|nr:hypothetical protein [Nocardia abscessus]MCC3326184.1 hypothetical protein [Nocardia abscessus]